MTFAPRVKYVFGAALAAAVAIMLALMAGTGVTPAQAGDCPNANSEPNQGSLSDFRHAIICLINEERTSRGKAALDSNAKLRQVAGDHTDVMLAQDCFEHRCAGEKGLTRRLRQVGYLQDPRWAYAENLGYEHTPRKMMDRWLGSDYHRRNLLSGEFEDMGVGVGRGTPNPNKPDGEFITYDVIVGTP